MRAGEAPRGKRRVRPTRSRFVLAILDLDRETKVRSSRKDISCFLFDDEGSGESKNVLFSSSLSLSLSTSPFYLPRDIFY